MLQFRNFLYVIVVMWLLSSSFNNIIIIMEHIYPALLITYRMPLYSSPCHSIFPSTSIRHGEPVWYLILIRCALTKTQLWRGRESASEEIESVINLRKSSQMKLAINQFTLQARPNKMFCWPQHSFTLVATRNVAQVGNFHPGSHRQVYHNSAAAASSSSWTTWWFCNYDCHQ